MKQLIILLLLCGCLQADAQQIASAEYFYDTDPGVGAGVPISTGSLTDSVDITFSAPITGLTQGSHVMYIRVKNTAGTWSLYADREFYIKGDGQAATTQIVAAEYYFDTEPGLGQGTPISVAAAADSIDITTNISTSSLDTGWHNLYIRVRNADGYWSLYANRPFYITSQTTTQTARIVAAEYFYDADPGLGAGTPIATGPAADSIDITTSLPITGLAVGTHTLYIRVRDSLGLWSHYMADTFNICNNPTLITPPPVAAFPCLNGSATFSVTASGQSLTYQWKKNGVNISGATSATYTDNSVSYSDTGTYTVVITGVCGSTTSAGVTLGVNPVPTITTSVQAVTVCPGAPASFSVAASGMNLSYQWKKDNVNITGATSSSYSIPAVAATDAGNYSVQVTNSCGNVTSTAVALTVQPVTAISTQPINDTACLGTPASFSVTATGVNLGYQWKFNGNAISGATSATYSIPSVVAGDAGDYTVEVTGTCGASVTSQVAALAVTTVPSAPTTISGPAAVCEGSSANYSIALVADADSYTWTLPGSWSGTSTSEVINVTAGANGGNITVTADNACGSSVSSSIPVGVLPLPATTITPAGATSFCDGDSVVLDAPANLIYQYQWLLNGTPIATANNASYTAAQSGSYSVTVDDNTCSATSAPVTVTVHPLPVPLINQTGLVLSTGSFSSYQWYKDGVAIPGATAQNHTATANGSYTVEVVDMNGCPGTSTSVIVTNVSVHSTTSTSRIEVYPNPFTNQFKVTGVERGSGIYLMDAAGKKVGEWTAEEDALMVTTTDLAAGVYLLKIVSVDGATEIIRLSHR